MSYYTYGRIPQTLWPTRNPPPLTQYQQQENAEVFDEPHEEGSFAVGGLSALGTFSLGGSPQAPPLVQGDGNGRADDVNARLSDGEYVIDAETVALLGDGNTEAGARALDQMREAIRAHKGQALAKGEFSPPARHPLDYLMGANDE